MTRAITPVRVACVASLLSAGTVAANTSAPGSPVTRELSGVPCSVTATFSPNRGSATMTYGGGGKDLVERLLALVVAAAKAATSSRRFPSTADGWPEP